MWIVFVELITENAVFLGGAAAATTIVEVIFSPFRTLARKFQKPQKVELIQPDDNPRLDVDSYLQIQKKMRADIKAELEDAHTDERNTLFAKIAELDALIANPDQALQAANEQITKLETLLVREGNDIGGDRLTKARTALEAGDYSIADEIFAEVEARADLEVQSAARAAFGRGEIAEAEIRWADAATHYSKAARLDPSYVTLGKAGTFLWRAGQHKQSIKIDQDLLDLAQQQYGETDPKTITALNNLALSFHAEGNYTAAEQLYRQALALDAKTLGTDHPDYATNLNNLAGLLDDKDDYAAAEPLFRQALAIAAKTIGVEHPTYAKYLNNLASLLQVKGDHTAAEPLFRQVLEIDAKTIGTGHPTYATHLNNLALLLHDKADYAAAEPLFQQAVSVSEAALGAEHPDSKRLRKNLESFLRDKP